MAYICKCMRKISEKIPSFLFGLSVGVIGAGLFFIFKLDDYFTKMDFSKNEIREISSTKINPETVVSEKQSISNNEKISKSEISKSNSKISNKENKLISSPDSLNIFNESIKLLTEELLAIKNVTLKDYDQTEKRSAKDSMLSAMSGIQESKSGPLYMIEFRKTPLNSKGYKMTRNRVLLYGINETDEIELIRYNSNFYLRCSGSVYKLEHTIEFHAFEKVSESELPEKSKIG